MEAVSAEVATVSNLLRYGCSSNYRYSTYTVRGLSDTWDDRMCGFWTIRMRASLRYTGRLMNRGG